MGGRQLEPTMPFETFQHLNADEMQALYLYLQTQPG